MLDISNFGKGALIQPIAIRDYRLELVGAASLPSIFSVRDKVGQIKNQDGSSSCVGQAFSYYAEILNTIETGQKVQLSARDIYSLIYQPEGGSYLKDAASKICNTGVIPETEATSYEMGNPPTETFMRYRGDITQQSQDDGMSYLASKYLTWDSSSVDWFKQAILQGNGVVVACKGNNYGWSNATVLTPDNLSQVSWSHAICLVGYDDPRKEFIFVNSWGSEWGEEGFGYLPYEYIEKGYVSNPFTLIDVPNSTYISMLSIIKNLLEKIISILKGRK